MIFKIQLILVDDHELVRDGIKLLLMSSEKIEVIGEASHSDQLEELIEDQDFNLPKAIVVATEEFMNDELDWKIPESENLDEK